MPVAYCYNPDEVFVREEVILGLRKKEAWPSGDSQNCASSRSRPFVARDKRDRRPSESGRRGLPGRRRRSRGPRESPPSPREGRVARCLAPVTVAVGRTAVRMSRFFGVWRVLNV